MLYVRGKLCQYTYVYWYIYGIFLQDFLKSYVHDMITHTHIYIYIYIFHFKDTPDIRMLDYYS